MNPRSRLYAGLSAAEKKRQSSWTHEQLGFDECSTGWSPWGASVEHKL